MPAIRSRHVVVFTAVLGALGLTCGVSLSAASGLTAPPATASQASATAPAGGAALFVSPTGSDKAAGSATAPLATVQAALNLATPGTTIHLAPGVYARGGTTRHDGTASAPITIEGPLAGVDATAAGTAGTATATVTSTTSSHILTIANSYYVVDGFSIDGQPAIESQAPVATWPADGSSVATVTAFKNQYASIARNDRLIYIDGNTTPVQGTVIENMSLTGAGGECVHVRDDTTDTVITRSLIRWCGMYPRRRSGDYTYHNGEGVYVGTSPKSTDLSNHDDDQTNHTSVIGNVIETFGSECFDVKENAHDNLFSANRCSGDTEPVSDLGSDVELRGYANTVSSNVVTFSAGAGIKIASDSAATDLGGNAVMNNKILQTAGVPILLDATATQGAMCGNTTTETTADDSWSRPC